MENGQMETEETVKPYEDDGMTVADMSRVETPTLLSRWFGSGIRRAGDDRKPHTGQPETKAPSELLEGKERRYAIRGAIAASLLIGLIYVGGAGLVILFLLWIWGAL